MYGVCVTTAYLRNRFGPTQRKGGSSIQVKIT